MKKIVMLVASAVFALGLSVGAQAADAPKGAAKVSNFGKKEAVTFDHAKHQKDLKCADCHHNEKEGKFKCGECHGKDDDAKTKAPKFQDAAHKKDKGSCYGCHFTEKHKLKCADCHKK